MKLSTAQWCCKPCMIIYQSTSKSPIIWILSEAEECNHLLMKTLRLRSVSNFLCDAFWS
jgi:hypothetical protein